MWFSLSVRDGLRLGGSRDWKEAMFVMTDERELQDLALLEHCQPLYEFCYYNTIMFLLPENLNIFLQEMNEMYGMAKA